MLDAVARERGVDGLPDAAELRRARWSTDGHTLAQARAITRPHLEFAATCDLTGVAGDPWRPLTARSRAYSRSGVLPAVHVMPVRPHIPEV